MRQTPVETEEELQWVMDYMLLPVVLDVLERDIRAMDTMKLKMPLIYIRSLRRLQDRATSDMAVLRGKLKSRGIRVYEQRRTEERLEADFLCRSYHRKCSMLWGLVKSEVERKLVSYLELNLAE
ncbi:hypothetical protein [Paenibacillus ginsengarvi]|uniref:Uncharacterized protein n=1 Tax=Paenibacillus ginsengarvi TaxID=400777 RepID=A0A3B0BK52_9BACL|nr:hypothetical protein [Paenibacillus ginsengarvi]RKN72377.1 hypothetical protein D7M11_28260 [Paenibacillus ginsengarvi]